MIERLLAPFDRVYADRSWFERLRARAMLGVYVLALIATIGASINDMFFGQHSLALHLTTDSALLLGVGAGLALLLRGHDERATLAVPALLVAFSLATVAAALDGRPDRFYSGWSRWFPVFIAVNGLFLTTRGTVLTTTLAIGWTGVYYPLFAHRLAPGAPPIIPSDVTDTISVELLVGVITLASVLFVRAALDTWRKLNDDLEALVVERTRQLGAVIDHMADGLVAYRADGEVRVANDQVVRLLGDPLPDRLRELADEARRTGRRVDEVLTLPQARFASVSATPMPDDGGVVALVRDITVEREVDRLKTEFIATVSHELRTPMTSVLGFSKMIATRLRRRVAPALVDADPKAREAFDQVLDNVEIVVSEGQRLTDLINDVLDIAKMEAGGVDWRRDPVDVAALVRKASDAARGLFPERGPVELVVEVAPDLPAITGDEPRLMQVLVNLLSNAAKFTERGRVTLAARAAPGGVELSVADTGRGIPEAQLARIFERFQQVEDTLTDKPSGTGLGLPICRQIALAHGADIQVESVEGQGSRFWLVLPT